MLVLPVTGDQELVNELVLNHPVKPPLNTKEEDGFLSLATSEKKVDICHW